MVFSVVLTYNVSFSDNTTELEPVTTEFEAVSVEIVGDKHQKKSFFFSTKT